MKTLKFPGGGRAAPAILISGLALFVSLGGISYAAMKLPFRSVGPAQMRNAAVKPRALSMPVSQVGVTRENLGDLLRGAGCNPLESCHGWPTDVPVEARIVIRRPGSLRVSGVVSVAGQGKPEWAPGRAVVAVTASLDGQPMGPPVEATLLRGETVNIPVERLAPAGVGEHLIELSYDATSQGPINVSIPQASLMASASGRG